MKETIVLLTSLGAIFAIALFSLHSLNQEVLKARLIKSETTQFFENYTDHKPKTVDIAIEQKLDTSSAMNFLEDNLVRKIDNLQQNIEDIARLIYQKSLERLPKEVAPQTEKFESELTIDLRKPSFRILDFESDTLYREIVEESIKYEQLSTLYNTIRNIMINYQKWFNRYLEEKDVGTRVNQLLEFDFDNELSIAKTKFEVLLREITETYQNKESKIIKEENNIDFSKEIETLNSINAQFQETVN